LLSAPLKLREKDLIEIIIRTGLRLSDIREINSNFIDWDSGMPYITVHEKTDKLARISLPQELHSNINIF
jgi:site-specific recombinase XerC